MPLTVLTDSEVSHVLHNLTKQDILDLQQTLADALHYYSTAVEEDSNGCSSAYQPLRTSLKRNDGQTTLFMPASSNDGLGVKIVTQAVPKSDNKSTSSVAASSSSGSGAASLASLDSSSVSQPSTSTSTSTSTSISGGPPPSTTTTTDSSSQNTSPKGILTLLDRTGAPRAMLNAEEFTAFRTALASTMLFKKRQNVHDVLVFGAGKQAYWHIRLALLLRGPEIHHLNIINRSFDRAQQMVQSLFQTPPSSSGGSDLPRPKIQIITNGHREYERLLKQEVRAASVLFCTTPSLTPLFPATHLTHTEGRKKGRYIAAIGSYKPHMAEIHPDVLKQNVAPDHGRHHHKHALEGGAIIVDSVEACLKEAGEVIQAGIKGEELVEVGELIMLRKEAERKRAACKVAKEEEGLDERGVELGECEKMRKKRGGGGKGKEEGERDGGLMEWLRRGNVIFKMVGMGLMDVVVGMDLVRLADERGVGTRIEDF